MRAQVPEPQGAASTWPGPHTSAFGETPAPWGSAWTRTLSPLVLPRPGTLTSSWALTASRTAMPRWAIRFASSRRTATPSGFASTTAKTLATPGARSPGRGAARPPPAPRHLHDSPGEDDERGVPAGGALANAIALGPRDGLADARL